MREAGLRAAGEVRPPGPTHPGAAGGDDPGRLRAALSRDRGRPLRGGLPRLAGGVPPTRGAQCAAGASPGRGQHASGSGGSHGGPLRASGGPGGAGRPRFDEPVPRDGYRWWYLDGRSDDGRFGLVLIALLGSVFSPYYVRARRRGAADPLDHCALNVALYGAGRKRWALTERSRRQLRREPSALVLGPSTLAWEGDALTARIAEVTVPLPSRLRGTVRLHPGSLVPDRFALDTERRHHWRAIAPCARIEVDFERPALRWSGRAYLDSNWGQEPLEEGFASWSWSRSPLPDGGTAVLYDLDRRRGGDRSLALRFAPGGQARGFSPPPPVGLPRTLWRVGRTTRADPGRPPAVLRTLEDTPFYARSLLGLEMCGEPLEAVHESLSLERFRRAWVRGLLPFRMPRRP